MNKHSKCKTALFCAASLVLGALADENNATTIMQNEPTDGESNISAKFSVDFCSKFLSYGLVDNPDPIMTPSASISFFDTISFDIAWIFDTTHWGRKGGYRDRRWQYQELDIGAGISHGFTPEEVSLLPTTVKLGAGYMYEYHPRFSKAKSGGVNGNPDTQFVTLDVALPDLWIEPALNLEWDIDRDHGFYANLNIGHTFELVGEGEDAMLTMRMQLAQGLGSADRNQAYLDEDKWGLMDTSLSLSFDYKPVSWLSVSPYVAYYDYLFDSTLRDASRGYCENWDKSWNFIGGITLTASF
jgi:hypothetical protein